MKEKNIDKLKQVANLIKEVGDESFQSNGDIYCKRDCDYLSGVILTVIEDEKNEK